MAGTESGKGWRCSADGPDRSRIAITAKVSDAAPGRIHQRRRDGGGLVRQLFLGFGIISFTAKDLRQPSRQLPKAMYLALGIATVIYIAIALGVFGTLTVGRVISSGSTALAVAAEPAFGKAGYWLMSVTALFATAGATMRSRSWPPAGPPDVRVHHPPPRAGLDGHAGAILVLSIALDLGWKRARAGRADHLQAVN